MFTIHKTDTGAVVPWEYLPAAAGEYKAGQMLEVKNGNLTAIGEASTKTPGYLCMGNVTAAAGDPVPVTRVQKDAVYETTLSVQTAGAVVGARLQISAGGEQVDGGAAGTFEVVDALGTEAGAIVHGRFV